MDQARLDQSLQDFDASLPETPVYVILMKQSDEIMSRWGELAGKLSSTDIARMTSALGFQERDTLDSLNHGNLQYAIHAGGTGVYFIVNLIDTYWLGISYQRIGVTSFDAVVQGILMYFQIVLDVIYF